MKNWLTGKDPDDGKDWREEEKGMTEDEMVGWHHWHHGHESEQAPGVGDGQGSLAFCSSWGCRESDKTEQLNWWKTEKRLVGGQGLVRDEKAEHGGCLWHWTCSVHYHGATSHCTLAQSHRMCNTKSEPCRLWVIMLLQCWFIGCIKCTIQVGDVDNGGGEEGPEYLGNPGIFCLSLLLT